MSRNTYAPEFKAKLALAVLCGEKTATELSREFDVNQTLIYKWAKQIKKSAADIFSGESEPEVLIKKSDTPYTNTEIVYITREERDFLLNGFGK